MKARRGFVAVVLCGAACGASAQYVDREIDPKTLPPDTQDASWLATGTDPSGWPRTFSLTTRYQSSSIDGGPSTSALWSALRATLDTPNHGALTLDAAYSPDAGSLLGTPVKSGSWTLTQRRLPFGAGWFADNAIGVVQSGNLDAVNQQYRFGVTSRLMLGASSSVVNEPTGWGLIASSGSLVALDSVGQAGYADLGGQASTVGFRWKPPGSGWSYALQASDYRRPQIVSLAAPGISGQGVLQLLRHEGSDAIWQLNVLGTRSQGTGSGLRVGGWLDASIQDGAVEHRFGANALRPDQEWLGVPVAAGATGGYYRWRYRTRQTLVEAQVDAQSFAASDGVPGSRFAQFWGNARRQLDQSTGVGAQLIASRTGDTRAVNLLAYREVSLPEGGWRALTGALATTGQRTEWQIGGDVSRTWFEIQFNAALSAFIDGGAKVGTDASLNATRELGERTSFTLGLRRYNAIIDASAGTSISATLQRRLSAGWSLSAALSDSRGAQQLRAIGSTANAPAPAAFEIYTPRLRFVWLSLRYDFGAGSPELPLGARPGVASAGGGRIEGVVFLDTNGNGRPDPGESVAAGVTVVLDGLYAVRTDALGRYAFEFVVSGEHRLQVLPDNIPLPWLLGEQALRSVSLSPRGAVQANFGAVRN